jgi:kynurenine formamidase
VDIGGRPVRVDLAAPFSLALELDFALAQPQHFGAPPATARPYAVEGFSGSVATGASCNCSVVSLIPHCNGTHTEGVGHLTREPFDAYRLAPPGPIPAVLVSVEAVPASDALATEETTDPTPHAADTLITRQSLERAWPLDTAWQPQALVIRTGYSVRPATPSDPSRKGSPPYLTRPAAALLVERNIDHLIIDLPSLDRDHDQGRLTAHRTFFGLPAGTHSLAEARRRNATVTELAAIPAHIADGRYLLSIQVPAWRGDAVPSRPLLYPLITP